MLVNDRTCVVTIHGPEQAYGLLQVKGLSKEVRSRLMAIIAYSGNIKLSYDCLRKGFLEEDLPDADELWTLFAGVLTTRHVPRFLVELLKANPQGQERTELLSMMNERPATAYKALLVRVAHLTSSEKDELAESAVSISNKHRGSKRAKRILPLHQDASAEVRLRLVECASFFPDHAQEILSRPEEYFSEPGMTKEERALLIASVQEPNEHSRTALHLLLLSRNADERHNGCFLSEEEWKGLIPAAVVYAVACDYWQADILGSGVAVFLTDEQKEQLGVKSEAA